MDAANLHFGPFRLDPGTKRLWRELELLHLRSKAFAVLHLLVRHSRRLDQDPVSFRDFALGEIAQHRNFDLVLSGKFFLGRSVVRTDSKNLGLVCIEFSDTSLVRCHFLRSTTGESGREKGQDDVELASEITQRHLATSGGVEREIRSHVAFFQVGLGRRHGLAEKRCCQGRAEHDD